jgi:DNA-binding response OmpR family regulator
VKTLLIVDDETKICQFLSRFFEARGFRILTAQSGQEALERLNDSAPDCLLLDLRMPDLSGLEVLKLAKAKFPQLRVVVVSALDDPQTVETAFRLGANDYIPKPLSFDQRDWARAFFAADN